MAFKKMITAVDTHAGEPMYLIPQIHSRKDSGWVIYGRCKDVTGNEKDCFTLNSGFLLLCKGDSEDLLNLDFGNDIYWTLRVP
ncbi:MAG: hypothetical protein PVI94_21690 [Desulfobacterales bacterium]|jgi:hypothetical protein